VKAELSSPKAERNPKGEVRKVLVCFAVKEEAGAFKRMAGDRSHVKVILVGMGKRNAERAIRAALAEERPTLVLTCGFAAEKQALRQSTGADAVEMESQIIRAACHEQSIPSATVRVILDTAHEDLPLDFNQLMTADQKMDIAKLTMTVAKSPGKFGALLKLRRQSQAAAEKLAQVLVRITAA
jgi:nucleoside phosphorylase